MDVDGDRVDVQRRLPARSASATASATLSRPRARGHRGAASTPPPATSPPRLTGNAVLHTASGDVRVRGLSGRVELDTDSGRRPGQRPALHRRARRAPSSGDVELDFAACPRRVDAETASGDVRIAVPPGCGRPTASTSRPDSGEETVDVDRDERPRPARAARGHAARATSSVDVRGLARLARRIARRPARTEDLGRVLQRLLPARVRRRRARRRGRGAGARRGPAGRAARAGGELLDVPCGFGRHSIPLARAGYRVTGVDRSAVLLAEAQRRAGGERWPKFVERRLPRAAVRGRELRRARSTCTRRSATSATRRTRRCWPAIRRVLRAGGRLVIETMHRDRLVGMASERHWRLMGEGRLLLEQSTFDPASGVAQTTQTLIDGDGAARVAHVLGARLHGDRAARDDRARRLLRRQDLRRTSRASRSRSRTRLVDRRRTR